MRGEFIHAFFISIFITENLIISHKSINFANCINIKFTKTVQSVTICLK